MEEIRKNKYWAIAVVALLITNSISGYLYFNHAHQIADFENPYPLIDFSRDFVGQEHYLVNTQPLRDRVHKLVEDFGPDSVSVYIEYLNTGANISINPDLYIWPASLNKLPVAMVVMKKVEKEEWELTNELVLLPDDRNLESGDKEDPIGEHPDGTRFTIQELLEETLINSDNTAFRILRRNLHNDEIIDLSTSIGLEEIAKEEGRVSGKEYSRLFRSLYTASYLDRENSQKILEWLAKSTFGDFLSSGMPEGTLFAHKYGERIQENVYSDSGIVYLPNRPYIITVMVQGDENKPVEEERKKAIDLMTQISKESYEYFSGY